MVMDNRLLRPLYRAISVIVPAFWLFTVDTNEPLVTQAGENLRTIQDA